jgi:hypothetical protein
LKKIPRVDWDSVMAANLIRVWLPTHLLNAPQKCGVF